MAVHTVAILSPGDMGSGVGQALGQHNIDVITCLRNRSNRTRELAGWARIRDVPSMRLLVSQADLILSILVPEQAVAVAREVADAMRSSGQTTVYAECNAVSPQTTRKIEAIISASSQTARPRYGRKRGRDSRNHSRRLPDGRTARACYRRQRLQGRIAPP